MRSQSKGEVEPVKWVTAANFIARTKIQSMDTTSVLGVFEG
ncbi:hypothetical protein AB4211_02685 [Vibrio lentus]